MRFAFITSAIMVLIRPFQKTKINKKGVRVNGFNTCMITTGLPADGVATDEGVRGQETVTLEEAEIPATATGVEEGTTFVNS